MTRRRGAVVGLVVTAAIVAACGASAVSLSSWVRGTWACTISNPDNPDGSVAIEITVNDGTWIGPNGNGGKWSVTAGGLDVSVDSGNSDPASTGTASGLGDATSKVPSRGSVDATWTFMDGYAGETGTGDLGVAIDGKRVTFTYQDEGSDQEPTVTVCTKK